ncbi:hypothetical protein [Thermomonospora catenispora]|uniref:hypothetical protein n=1 Tax=Thermomonospora catenispora TaxID=2493090 RepID=UPI00158897F3|nr:hypothetical protein [Thermomonospora catenispora]
MIYQDSSIGLWIKNLMGEHHESLIVDFCYISVPCMRDTSCVDLSAFGLDSEVKKVPSWKRVAHPDAFAILKCFISMSCCGYAMISELPEERQQDLLYELVLAAFI